MALESLLASIKNDVSHVADVQASNRKAFGCNGSEAADVSDVSPMAAAFKPETSATAGVAMTYQRKPLPIGACTAATAETPKNTKAKSEARKASPGDTATASRWWLIHYTDCDPLEVSCCPEPTHAEVLAMYHEAIAAEPMPERYAVTATPEQEAELGALVASVSAAYAFTPAEQQEALVWALRDPDNALRSFRALATEAGVMPDPFPDDRRTCNQCSRLTYSGRCMAWKELGAIRNYSPVSDIQRRCEGYAPGPDDPDRRGGLERWPGLEKMAVSK